MNSNNNKMRDIVDSTLAIGVGRLFIILGVPVMCVLLASMLNKADDNTKTITQINNGVITLQVQMMGVSADPYHGQDARRDFKLRDQAIEDLKERVKALEYAHADPHR